MLIGPSYEWLARQQIATFADHAGAGPRRFGALIGEILARWLVAEPIDALRGDIEGRLARPISHRRPYFVPLMGLQSALSAAVLNLAVDQPLLAAANALDASQADARTSDEHCTMAGWGVAIASWLGDGRLAMRWTRERMALSPLRSEPETAILVRAWERERESDMLATRPGLAPMLAVAALAMGDHHQVLLATLLLASGVHAESLSLERSRVDADLWSASDPYRPRAKFVPTVWSVQQQALQATVDVIGDGGPIWAVAPFMQPLFLLADALDCFTRGEGQLDQVQGLRSKSQLAALLADPAATIEICYRPSDPLLLDATSIAAYQVVVDAIARWMTLRHGDGFRARLVLSTPGER